jgi:hypothetical protein
MSAKDVYVPSHPGLFEVDFRDGEYCSALIACKVRPPPHNPPVPLAPPGAPQNLFLSLSQDFDAGQVMVHLTDLTKGPKSYATLQCGPGPDDHVLVNSDLSYGVCPGRGAPNAINNNAVVGFLCSFPVVFFSFWGVARITVNHSCEPNAAFDVSGPDQAKWHMRALKRIATGEPGKQP